MKYSVYIATSVDGFIAKEDGSVDWLHTAGNTDADMGDQSDMGFSKFIESATSMDVVASCNHLSSLSAMA